MRYGCLTAALLLTAACGGTESPPEGSGGSGGSGTAKAEIRGERYCEILAGFVEGTNVRIDVYNTFGLNDCPEDTWSAIDPAAVQAQLGASTIRMNGPRRWMIDRFTNSAWLDPTQVTLGGLAMRKAGQLVMPLAEAMTAGSPYVTHTIQRDTTYVFDAGKDVYELVDPMGRVFVMQSLSMEHEPLTETDLPGLAAKLTPPAGWSYDARTLSAPMEVTAVDGTATILQDDLADTYQLAQP